MPQNMQIESVLILFAPRLTLKDAMPTLRESKLSLFVTNWQITHPLMRKSTASFPSQEGTFNFTVLKWIDLKRTTEQTKTMVKNGFTFDILNKMANNSPHERGWGCVLF